MELARSPDHFWPCPTRKSLYGPKHFIRSSAQQRSVWRPQMCDVVSPSPPEPPFHKPHNSRLISPRNLFFPASTFVPLSHILYALAIVEFEKCQSEQATPLYASHAGFQRSSLGLWGVMIELLQTFWPHLLPTSAVFTVPQSTGPFFLPGTWQACSSTRASASIVCLHRSGPATLHGSQILLQVSVQKAPS